MRLLPRPLGASSRRGRTLPLPSRPPTRLKGGSGRPLEDGVGHTLRYERLSFRQRRQHIADNSTLSNSRRPTLEGISRGRRLCIRHRRLRERSPPTGLVRSTTLLRPSSLASSWTRMAILRRPYARLRSICCVSPATLSTRRPTAGRSCSCRRTRSNRALPPRSTHSSRRV
jgi:hypothetical protein